MIKVLIVDDSATARQAISTILNNASDIERLQEVASIVKSQYSGKPVIVASAMTGITNLLLETAQFALNRQDDQVCANLEIIKDKHLQAIQALIRQAARKKKLIERQASLIAELRNLYHGVSLLKELSVRSLDAIASFGEILSCMQLAVFLVLLWFMITTWKA